MSAKDKRAGGKKISTDMSSSSVKATAKAEKERPAKINAVVKPLQFSSPDPTRGWAVRFPYNLGNTNVSADLTSAATVPQIFDHNGDPILNLSSREMK